MLFSRAVRGLVLLLWPALVCGQITEGPELDAAKSLVVMIEGRLGVAPTQGAGIIFAVQGDFVYIATAYHVVRPGEKRATDLKVRFWQRQTESFLADHYDDARSEHDLAVIRVRAPGLQFRLDRLADAASFKESDQVYAIGYPGGTKRWGVTYSPGSIDAVQTIRMSVQSVYIKKGHSGGALIDDRMRLVGMVLETDGDTAGVLRIDRLIEVLRRDIKVPVQLSLYSKTNLIDGQEYVWIPPGRFVMGCSKEDRECADDESPQHEVAITKGYWMGQTEVTKEAYWRVTGKYLDSFIFNRGPKRPVETVPWHEANDYCVKAGLRLPTEAEWEYAARAGSINVRQGELDTVAWYGANAPRATQDVGLKQPNSWKLYDMLGNVAEWVGDWYDKDYYHTAEASDPKGPRSGEWRVVRGGHWFSDQRSVRVSIRIRQGPSTPTEFVGFRCAGELR
jgi:formylglycine-generating enzyme required for sulfatase activity